MRLDKVIDLCYAALVIPIRQKGDTMSNVIVTEVVECLGQDVPVEALIFHPDGKGVIYSRLLCDPVALVNMPAGISVSDLFYDVVLN
jgi:hypothetical protein